MENSAKHIMKTRCDNIGVVLSLVFWGYALFLSVMLIVGVWMAFQTSDCFTVQTADTGNGMAAYTFFKDGFEVDFYKNVLREKAIENPKLTYLTGFSMAMVTKLLTLGILWSIRKIFKNIEKNETPFMKENCKAVSWIGIFIIAAGMAERGILPAVCVALGIGGWGNSSNVNWSSLLIGGIIICLAYMFEYGTALQQESDEIL